jgi:ribose transport system permease protein
MFAIFTLVWVLLSYTRAGRAMYATGGNLESARQSGVPVNRVRLLTYTLAGLLAAIAGILLGARIYGGNPVVGNSMTLDSIAAAIIGGTPFPGGAGGPVGTLGGAALLALIGNVLNMLEVSPYYQYIIKGLILAGALFFFYVRRRETAHAPA